MSMKKKSDPRRLYVRADQFLTLFDGRYFGKAKKLTKVDADQPVSIAVLTPSGGKRRIQVTQGEIVETWREQNVVFKPHTAKEVTVIVEASTPEVVS